MKSRTFVLIWFGTCFVSPELDDGSKSKMLKPWPPAEFPSVSHEYVPPEVVASDHEEEDARILSLKRADMFIGRRRRAIQEPSEDFLDLKAAEEIFGEEEKWNRAHKVGPPAPPDPALYNRQFPVAPSKVQHEVQHEPAFFSQQTRYLPPTSKVTPYDSNVDPNFPVDAPRARGLVNDGSQDMVDVEFRTGYRWNAAPPAFSFHRTFEIGPRGRQTAGFGYNSAPISVAAQPQYSSNRFPPYSRTYSFSGGPPYMLG